ncbi:MAG TPA: hypothetical protein VFZ73_13920 [Gemmatimonadaceae bacterium]
MVTDRVAPARLWAFALAVLGFVPFVNWIGGGHEAPWFATIVSEWASGSAIVIGSALVLFLVMRRFEGWWPRGWARIADTAARHRSATGAVLGLAALSLLVAVAIAVLSGRPLHIDELVQVMQARILADLQVARPADAYPEFFSALHVVDMNGKVFSQFPPGGPLMLVPGVLLGAPWLTGPVFGAVAVAAYWRFVHATETPGVALGAAALLAVAPFMVFMAGSHMNHVPTLAWLCVALVALEAVMRSDTPGIAAAFLLGLALGMMGAIRPLDGAAFALPAGVWLAARTLRRPAVLPALLASGAGVAVPIAGVLAYNAATTGNPLLFGYELLWGASHGLGFHRAPWGVTHTVARGLELVNLYFLRLQSYLFETPLPSLVPPILALAWARRLTPLDKYLLASGALLVAGYFTYWHDGFFLGPRFFYLLLPMLVLWTARLPSIVRERFPALRLDRLVLLAYAVSAAVAAMATLPARTRQYSNGILLARHDYLAPARRAGVEGALIFVRESWGSQVIARLHALGISRPEVETVYRSIDTCLLEETVSDLERTGVRDRAAVQRLRPLIADSLLLVSSVISPDGTERVLPGRVYSDVCRRRIAEDRAGYSFLVPLLAREADGNVYARELHARDTLLLRRYPERPIYLLRAASSEVGAPLILESLRLDSARVEWAMTSYPQP